MNLIDVTKALATEDQCLDFLEGMRWPDGVRCPVCGNDKISRVTREAKSKNKRTRIYTCLEKSCKSQFSATAGTVFHNSHFTADEMVHGNWNRNGREKRNVRATTSRAPGDR
jgi:hypothetical protein